MIPPKAVHQAGGNHFDDLRLDVAASIQAQEEWLRAVAKRPVQRSWLACQSALLRYRLLQRAGAWEPWINLGLEGAWFHEFADYWHRVLAGRPLTVMDFHQLRFLYRCRFQRDASLSWSTPQEHVANWQDACGLFSVFQFVYREALQPVRSWELLRLLKPGMRILEYGCAGAPMYRTWLRFGSSTPADWVLADIPGFPYHYSRHVFAADAPVRFCTIATDRFDDPLHGVDKPFDLIIVQEVFEHLHRPRFIAEYLLERLQPKGLIFFDYIASEAHGLDTPAGMQERTETLRYLAQRLDVVQGQLSPDGDLKGLCIGRKK
jgi:2-polyprenyl-3-methyl-5-hydroxy-6-metoxy-1,4-benzoquinol methylase